MNTKERLVKKKQKARKEVVLVKILEVLLAVRKSPSPPEPPACPMPNPPPSDLWSRTKIIRKTQIIIWIDNITANMR